MSCDRGAGAADWLAVKHMVLRPSRSGGCMGLSGLLRRRLARVLAMSQPEARAYSGRKSKAPKEPLRHIKNRAKQEAGERHGPAVVYVQVVAAGSRDAGASVYVFSDHNRYLFNCGEGAQRLMHENKVKLSRLDNVFITRMDWANVGGLSGVLLTLRDLGLPKCTLSGPPQLKKFLQAIKSYCGPMDGLTVDVQPYTDPLYSDETMAVTQVPTVLLGEKTLGSPPRSPKPEDDGSRSEPRPGRTSPDFRGRPSSRSPPSVISYICKLHDRKGHFLVVKAKEIGLPVGTREIGPLIAQLKAGRSVMYEGKEISPADVLDPSIPGPTFIVVECPSEDFIAPVTENAAWKRYQEGEAETAAALVIHMTPEHILNRSTYRQWMERFGPSTEHLLLNEHTSTVHNLSSYKVQSQLHLIHPDIFPQLPEIRPLADEASAGPGVRAECLLKYQLRPLVGWQRDQVAQKQTCEFVKEAMELPGFGRAVEECRRLLQAEDTLAAEGNAQHPEVVFLGTGSAIPMKTRNVSSTLVHISPSALLLLDCGEGTFGQLHRHYGDRVDDILSRLSAVFISHIHADHHTGLFRLVLERERALVSLGKPFSPIMVIGPTILMTWINQYNDNCQEVLHKISFVPSWSLMETAEVDCPKTRGLIAALLETYRLEKFQTCFVRHCRNAFGCAIVHQSGWKLVFSGDTMPCDALVRMGKDASLLIHEATLEDGLEQDAIDKAHSTTSQAIAVGMDMNADFMMLNHFSQRYAKLPLMNDGFSGKVGVSFDHMRIRLRDLQTLPKLMAPLRALFAEDLEELEERKQKREQRLQEPEAVAPSPSKPVPSAKRDLDDAANMAAAKRLKAN
ncbi:zinc phosphodiesterase ELAC protein 2 [Dendrobates tinctorius]|uniref:zinc phosphodiesterase ELAC protein 2 n=1 Tax=Dendrobates tinctorius TaxID=92724 RepID=UPI003CC9C128